jgi:hypothetical protein
MATFMVAFLIGSFCLFDKFLFVQLLHLNRLLCPCGHSVRLPCSTSSNHTLFSATHGRSPACLCRPALKTPRSQTAHDCYRVLPSLTCHRRASRPSFFFCSFLGSFSAALSSTRAFNPCRPFRLGSPPDASLNSSRPEWLGVLPLPCFGELRLPGPSRSSCFRPRTWP